MMLMHNYENLTRKEQTYDKLDIIVTGRPKFARN